MSRTSAQFAVLSKSEVSQRPGWNDRLIDRFLPEPAYTKENPANPGGERLRFWYLSDVLVTEQTYGWKRSSYTVSAPRNQHARDEFFREATDRSQTRIKTKLKSQGSINDVRTKALSHYNKRQKLKRPEWEDLSIEGTNRFFMDRLCVNFLRHQATDYDKIRVTGWNLDGRKVEVDEKTVKIYDTIARRYPELSRECARQLEQRGLL